MDSWAVELEDADAVVNLTGKSVDCRYHSRNRDEILRSRIDSVNAVGRAIAACRTPPRVWLQASTATLYAHRYDAANDEVQGLVGGAERHVPETWRFSIEVARAWEKALADADTPRTRKVALRSAMTMHADRGSVFDVLRKLARRGLGGRQGDGRQYVSWIHGHDFCRALDWILEHDDLEGSVNVCAPHPLPNAEFLRHLRGAVGAPFSFPTPAWMLEVGAFFLRTETELLLKSRRVVPGRLLESGFSFDYPTWAEALTALV